jgi:hypothetical protein
MNCELNEKLQHCIEQTSRYVDSDEDTWNEMPTRNIIVELKELAPGWEKDFEIVDQKIREANLILLEIKQFLRFS